METVTRIFVSGVTMDIPKHLLGNAHVPIDMYGLALEADMVTLDLDMSCHFSGRIMSNSSGQADGFIDHLRHTNAIGEVFDVQMGNICFVVSVRESYYFKLIVSIY